MSSLHKMIVVALFTLGGSSVALAKAGSVQNHHCMKDGTEMADKTKKECKKEGGKWEKDKKAPDSKVGSEWKQD